jgi:hypothetical protein
VFEGNLQNALEHEDVPCERRNINLCARRFAIFLGNVPGGLLYQVRREVLSQAFANQRRFSSGFSAQCDTLLKKNDIFTI